jgi:glyoxylase-like metal-dependent hydrolase (beta-lactamase superfamily II)
VHEDALPVLREGRVQSPFAKEGTEEGGFFNPCIRYAMGFLSMLIRRKWGYPPVEVGEGDIVVKGDDPNLLNKIGVDGVILHTPGHSSDSISVVLDDGNAFVGDAAMNFMRVFGTRHMPIYVEDCDEVLESWRKLIKYKATVIYTAHGREFGADVLKRRLDREGRS